MSVVGRRGRQQCKRYAKRLSRAQAARQLKREETEDQARLILREYDGGNVPMRVLAVRFGMSLSTIYRRIDDARWQRRWYEREMARK